VLLIRSKKNYAFAFSADQNHSLLLAVLAGENGNWERNQTVRALLVYVIFLNNVRTYSTVLHRMAHHKDAAVQYDVKPHVTFKSNSRCSTHNNNISAENACFPFLTK
jgi:D-alanyl-D-alanine carboxypeptidase